MTTPTPYPVSYFLFPTPCFLLPASCFFYARESEASTHPNSVILSEARSAQSKDLHNPLPASTVQTLSTTEPEPTPTTTPGSHPTAPTITALLTMIPGATR
jgi:hypothetical protein